jgi:uncharacterized protein
MAISNHDRIGKALEVFDKGLAPYVEREMKTHFGDEWQEKVRENLNDHLFQMNAQTELLSWDTSALVSTILGYWQEVFSKTLGNSDRSLVFEIKDARNKWAHRNTISVDDAYRAIDSMQRLLAAVTAPEAEELDNQKHQIMRQRYEAQSRKEMRKATELPLESQTNGGLKPWREIVTPHPDVSSGRYQQAEFAADLNQVYRGEGSDEYRDAKEFFRRTYLTEGLKNLLSGALKRLSGAGGDPVIQLQTNFGGGKTHSMIALYHLFSSGEKASSLVGIESVFENAGVAEIPKANCAVLVAQALSVAISRPKEDGTVVRTMWGELAYQLGRCSSRAKEAFAMVADADAHGVSPGSDVLRELFQKFGPCLILIDEWVLFVRQLYGKDENPPPAGSFDANLSFAQALTEAARATKNTLIVASLPASDIEVGGEGGKHALARLEHTFGRIQSPWRPANAEEGFEIVRRRLFQDITDPKDFTARDAVIRAFVEMYRTQSGEFPSECRDAEYERLMRNAYPIHPELFKRLYDDWGTLDKFQRTRGVLRLMAAVIHNLWERNDGTLLIMPASIPLDAPNIKSELTQYLAQSDAWTPIIEKDVDGIHSLPLELDRDNPTFGRFSACRRVSRTLFVGSAPTLDTAHRGIEDNRIKLGCAQPKETISTFGDALRRLSDKATHLYLDGTRYWFSTQPSVTRIAQDRAEQLKQKTDEVYEEIIRRIKDEVSKPANRGEFSKVYPCLTASGDIPDEREARLVILAPEFCHALRSKASDAIEKSKEILNNRGNSPRQFRNTLAFLAPDKTRLAELESAVRQYLAWSSIVDEEKNLNLDHFQSTQAKKKEREADETVSRRLPETYSWLLAPRQEPTEKEAEWEEYRLSGDDPLAVRAGKKLKSEEGLVTNLAPTILRASQMDKFSLWRDSNHVTVKRLSDDFSEYLFLYRLKNNEVLLNALADGVSSFSWSTETFAFAESFDEATGKYRGLKAGENVSVERLENNTLIVKPEIALKQIQEQEAKRPQPIPEPGIPTGGDDTKNTGNDQPVITGTGETVLPPAPQAQRFHGTVELDATRLGRDAGQIAEAIVQHLAGIVGSKVKITLEIHAEIPEAVSEQVHRTVTENCRTLKFSDFGFEFE